MRRAVTATMFSVITGLIVVAGSVGLVSFWQTTLSIDGATSQTLELKAYAESFVQSAGVACASGVDGFLSSFGSLPAASNLTGEIEAGCENAIELMDFRSPVTIGQSIGQAVAEPSGNWTLLVSDNIAVNASDGGGFIYVYRSDATFRCQAPVLQAQTALLMEQNDLLASFALVPNATSLSASLNSTEALDGGNVSLTQSVLVQSAWTVAYHLRAQVSGSYCVMPGRWSGELESTGSYSYSNDSP